jgi:hypothetical protein
MSDNQTIPIRRQMVNVPDFVAKAATDVPQPKDIKYPTEIIPLPTKGWFYPESSILSSGEIEIKQMTAREEDLLANQELIKKGKVLDKLLESVIVNKAIKLDDVLVPDKNAIFIAMRRLAYGDDYHVSVTCPNPQCGKQNKIKINLSELAYKPFDFDTHPKGENNFTFKLPHSGVIITYKLMNKIDEQAIDAELAQIKKLSKDNTGELTTRLKYLLTSVDNNTDRSYIRKFVEEVLSAKDSLALRKHMREYNPDVDMTFNFKCSECDLERRLDMPIGASFLFPDTDA